MWLYNIYSKFFKALQGYLIINYTQQVIDIQTLLTSHLFLEIRYIQNKCCSYRQLILGGSVFTIHFLFHREDISTRIKGEGTRLWWALYVSYFITYQMFEYITLSIILFALIICRNYFASYFVGFHAAFCLDVHRLTKIHALWELI